MDLHKIISELQSEKQRLDDAILALERLATVIPQAKKRGRPLSAKPIEDEPPQKAQAQAKG